MSARGQDLAATPEGSEERFHARRLLPGFAKRLREVRGLLEFRGSSRVLAFLL